MINGVTRLKILNCRIPVCIFSLLFFGFATGEVEAGQKLNCKFKAQGAESVVPEIVVIFYEQSKKSMKVTSSFLAASDFPIVEAKSNSDTNKLLSLAWKVKNLRGSGKTRFDVQQRLNWNRATGQATIRG